MQVYTIITYVLVYLLTSCSGENRAQEDTRVRVGAEVLLDKHLDELRGKRIGLAMNPTAKVQGVHMLDTLMASGINVTALFAAEHGFRGNVSAGEEIKDGVDIQTGLPVFSLYGSSKRPSEEMLREVDIILFDMQDVGARFYTYNVTLGSIIEEATRYGKEVWILDRPNPAGGDYVSGWILGDEFTSFVGAYPIPMAHGMTLGELMNMAIGEQWLAVPENAKIKVIEMEGWSRDMTWPDTNLEWIPPSPNLPSFEHAYIYLGTVLFEGTNISEGRGTDSPFLTIGAPDLVLDEKAIERLESEFFTQIDTGSTTPVDIPGKAVNPKFEGVPIKTLRIAIHDYTNTDPVGFGVNLLLEIQKSTSSFKANTFINNLSGIELADLLDANEKLPTWDTEIAEFMKQRAPYLIY